MKRLSLYEAKVQLAKGREEQERLRVLWLQKGSGQAGAEQRAWEIQKKKNEDLLEQCAADPELRKHLTSFMVDFHGTQEPDWVKEKRLPEGRMFEFDESVRAEYAGLSKVLQSWLHENGFRVTDTGGGVTGWDVGVRGNYEDSTRLCDMAYEKFGEYITAGVLTVSLRFWGWRFIGWTQEEERKLLQGN